MLPFLALTLATSFPPDPDNVATSVERFADLPDVFVSQMNAAGPATRWSGLDHAVGELPWAGQLLKRPDLMTGWLEAFKTCPLPKKDQLGSRLENLESLLSYPPFKRRESGREREILITLESRCKAIKSPLPEGPCVSLARTAFPKSKMAHLYDAFDVKGDGSFHVFPKHVSVKEFKMAQSAAELELAKLLSVSTT